MKVKLKACPYCKGTAKGHIKTVESFRKIHNYYVECTECGASTERYNTECAYYLDGKRFSSMTKREAISKAVSDWNNEIFDTKTKLLHMTEQEKYCGIQSISYLKRGMVQWFLWNPYNGKLHGG